MSDGELIFLFEYHFSSEIALLLNSKAAANVTALSFLIPKLVFKESTFCVASKFILPYRFMRSRAISITFFPFAPVLRRIAISSELERLCGPRNNSFSRGRSSIGSSFTLEIETSYYFFLIPIQLWTVVSN